MVVMFMGLLSFVGQSSINLLTVKLHATKHQLQKGTVIQIYKTLHLWTIFSLSEWKS
jgi:hypothetical protein